MDVVSWLTATLGGIVVAIGVVTAFLVVNGGYVDKTTCPGGGGGTQTSWSWGIDDIIPYSRTTTPPCVSHTATRLLISWVGISSLNSGATKTTDADGAFVKQASPILRDISAEFVQETKEANAIKNFTGDKTQASTAVMVRAAQVMRNIGAQLKSSPIADDPDLVSLRSKLIVWTTFQRFADLQFATAVRNGSVANLGKVLAKSKGAASFLAARSDLNKLSLTLQARYPQLDNWGFLNTSGG